MTYVGVPDPETRARSIAKLRDLYNVYSPNNGTG